MVFLLECSPYILHFFTVSRVSYFIAFITLLYGLVTCYFVAVHIDNSNYII